MKANPGGQLAPSDVIGRDPLIARLWDILHRQSVVLTSERRIGKTQMVKKMQAEAPDTVLAIFRDLEDIGSALAFVEAVFTDVEGYLRQRNRLANRVRQFLHHLSGVDIGGVIKFPETAAAHWKTLLQKVLEDLVEYQDRPLVFFWDEFPLMLHKLRQQEHDVAAMEVLDALRYLRQTHPNVRMVLTGSVGLPNVITSLQAVGYTNDPTNDMKTITVPPLSSPDAHELAMQLLRGEAIPAENPDDVARIIATAVDNVPFYIHQVVDDLKFHTEQIDEAAALQIVDNRLRDPLDEWHMGHYRQRIDHYYATDQQTLALTTLDVLASNEPMEFDRLFNLIKSQMPLAEEAKEAVRSILTLLQRDHYLQLEPDGTYRFCFPLIRRWWAMHRG